MAHQHYKGTGNIHSFRGLLADGAEDRIRIQGPVGSIAWRITKFQIISTAPGVASTESIVQIFRETQSSPSATVDFTNDELLGVAYSSEGASVASPGYETIIFDNALFSRNIFVSYNSTEGSTACNYYIELEEVKVSAAGMAQLAVAASRRGYVPGT